MFRVYQLLILRMQYLHQSLKDMYRICIFDNEYLLFIIVIPYYIY